MDITRRIVQKQYQDLTYVLVDYSGLRTEEEAHAMADAAEKWITSQPRNSLFLVTKVKDTIFTLSTGGRAKSLAIRLKPYIVAEAVLGLGAVTRLAYNKVVTLRSKSMKAFDSESEALKWLAEMHREHRKK